MYHCHFEDVEHVQMGMTGIVFVRPTQNQRVNTLPPGFHRAYNSGGVLPNTDFNREFPILLNEIWTTIHDNDHNIQETIHTDYNPGLLHAQRAGVSADGPANDDPSLARSRSRR